MKILSCLGKETDPGLAKELWTTYLNYFPLLQNMFDHPEDQPEDTLSNRERLLAYGGGDENQLDIRDWGLIKLAIKAADFAPNDFCSLEPVKFTILWKKQPALTKKLLSLPCDGGTLFAYNLLYRAENSVEFLKQIWTADKEFFKQQCVGKACPKSLVKMDFERSKSILEKVCTPEGIREIIEYGRGKHDPDILATALLQLRDKAPLERFFAAMKDGRLPLDGFINGKIGEIVKSFPQDIEVKEISLIGCKLDYETVKLLLKTFQKLEMITIQTSDLLHLQHALELLFVDIKHEQKPFTIRFADITPIEIPSDRSELENARYAPVFTRVGIPDNERLNNTPQALLALSGRLTINRDNLKQVKKWLFSNPFRSFCDVQKFGQTLYECREIIKDKNQYIKSMLSYDGETIEKDKSIIPYSDKMEEQLLTNSTLSNNVKRSLLNYYLEDCLVKGDSEKKSILLDQEALETLAFIAIKIMDHKLDRLVHRYAFEKGIEIN